MELVYRPVIATALAAFRVMNWRVKVSGAEHLPRTGPAVIASNHVSYLDFVFVGAGAIPSGRLVRFAAKREIFEHPISGPLMRGMKHIPVDRGGRVQDAFEQASEALAQGEVVGMFVEGTISRSFVPLKAFSGSARMAMDAGAPLIPCAVWGPQRLWTKGRPRDFRRNVEVRVAYGPKIQASPADDAREVTARLMEAIRTLLAGQQRLYSQEPSGPDDRWWLPAHLGGTAPTPEVLARVMADEAAAKREAKKAASA